MKKILLPTICILLCTLCVIFVPTEAEASIYEDTVRLHILASSDSIEDQNIKLMVRDFILNKYGNELSKAKSSSEAQENLKELLPYIESDCNLLILNTGYDYTVKTELSEQWFDTRNYGSFSLPSGRYISLTVTIGSGEGQNWWCVMYPPICLESALSDSSSGFSDDEFRLISKSGYNVKFKLLEVSSAIFNEESKKFKKSS